MSEKICDNCGERMDSGFQYCPKCKGQSFHIVGEVTVEPDNSIVHKLFYWLYPGGYSLSKSKVLAIAIFIYLILFWYAGGANLIFVPLAWMIAGIVFLIGYAIHQFRPKKSAVKLKYDDNGLVMDLIHLLFFWQNKNGNYIVSKTKVLSFLVFLSFTILGLTIFKQLLIFSSILFGVLLTIPVYVISYGVHLITNHDDSKPQVPAKNVKQVEKVQKAEPVIEDNAEGVVAEYVAYKNEINRLNNEFANKQKNVCDLIEKRFAPPQLTYTKFMSVVDKSKKLFDHETDSALTMIDLATEYSPKIDSEIKSKINILNTIIDKLEDLTNELVLTMNTSDDEDVDELFDNLNNLINSVKDYE